MQFNVGKCKVLHIGRNNPRNDYTMEGQQLKAVEEEKDIGVYVTSNLKPSKQCMEAAHKANVVLGQISRTFHFRDRHVFLQLYKQFVRVHLEVSGPAWNPWLARDIDCLENVQKGRSTWCLGSSRPAMRAS